MNSVLFEELDTKLAITFLQASDILVCNIQSDGLSIQLATMKPKFDTHVSIFNFVAEVDNIVIGQTAGLPIVYVNPDWYAARGHTVMVFAIYLLHAIIKSSMFHILEELLMFRQQDEDNNPQSNLAETLESSVNKPEDSIEHQIVDSLFAGDELTTNKVSINPMKSTIHIDMEAINLALDLTTYSIITSILPDITRLYDNSFSKEIYPEAMMRKSVPGHPIYKLLYLITGRESNSLHISRNNSNTSSILPQQPGFSDIANAINTLKSYEGKSISKRVAVILCGCGLFISSLYTRKSNCRVRQNIINYGAEEQLKEISSMIYKLSTQQIRSKYSGIELDSPNITMPGWISPPSMGLDLRKIYKMEGKGGEGQGEGTGQPATMGEVLNSLASSTSGEIIKDNASLLNEVSQQAGRNNILGQMIIQVSKSLVDKDIQNAFDKAINKISSVKKIAKSIIGNPKIYRGVIPTSDRRAIIGIMCNILPTFYDDTIYTNDKNESGEVAVYLDVSGSMDNYIPKIYSICASLGEYLSEHIYLFSNDISKITLRQLKSGEVNTTGGTDLDCVLLHYAKIASQVHKIVIFTDGYWDYEQASIDEVKKVCHKDVRVWFIGTPDGVFLEEFPLPNEQITMKE